jgi:hypothetical protein
MGGIDMDDKKYVWVLRMCGWTEPRLILEGNLEQELKSLDLDRGIAELYLKVLR